MDENSKIETAKEIPQSHSASEDELIDILKTEYISLLGLYTHTEDTLFGIFNFFQRNGLALFKF